jgi:integrase
MSRNIGYQFQNAIDSNFREGIDKHSLKSSGETFGHVFSYGEKRSLLQIGYEMKNYTKGSFPNIKMVRDIKPEHWNSFLQKKSETCGQVTLRNYASRIGKLEDLVNKRYGTNVDWRSDIDIPLSGKAADAQRVQSMDPKDFQKIMSVCQNSTSRAAPAVQLAGVTGARVNELAVLKPGDINVQKCEIALHGKGGRDRVVSVDPKYLGLLQEIKQNSFSEKSCFGLKQDSITKFLNRTMVKIGIKKKYPETSIHAIRKMVAQEKWDQLREQGCSKKETMQKISQFLGHGRNRTDIMRVYVGNRH